MFGTLQYPLAAQCHLVVRRLVGILLGGDVLVLLHVVERAGVVGIDSPVDVSYSCLVVGVQACGCRDAFIVFAAVPRVHFRVQIAEIQIQDAGTADGISLSGGEELAYLVRLETCGQGRGA